jgi:hypothetical protein
MLPVILPHSFDRMINKSETLSPPTSVQVKENVDLYIHSPIRLHGVMLS